MNNGRLERIIDKMKDQNLSQLIITSSPDLFYLLGSIIHSGERLIALYISTEGKRELIINEIVVNLDEISSVHIKPYNDSEDAMGMLVSLINENEVLGIDKNWPSSFLIELMERMPGIKFLNSSSIIDHVRMIKDKEEVEKLRYASNIVDKVMGDLIKILRDGITEKEAAERLKDIFAKYGTLEFSFEPIIAYGANGADPHHSTSDSLPKEGDSVVIDIGGLTNHYCSDITRTIFFGTPVKEAREIYEIVLNANKTAIEAVKPGVRFSDIDRAARQVIEDAGYGEYFTHRTGHCIGIEEHEPPSVSSNNNMEVQAGMVFSIEPGIYIPGKYGVRIEDLVLVTESGREVLNNSPKELLVI